MKGGMREMTENSSQILIPISISARMKRLEGTDRLKKPRPEAEGAIDIGTGRSSQSQLRKGEAKSGRPRYRRDTLS